MQKYGKSGLDFRQMVCYNEIKGEQMFLKTKKYIRKLRQQFSNVLNHGYAKANPNLIAF